MKNTTQCRSCGGDISNRPLNFTCGLLADEKGGEVEEVKGGRAGRAGRAGRRGRRLVVTVREISMNTKFPHFQFP